MAANPKSEIPNPKLKRLVPLLLDWFAANARDLPWRRTRDPYAIWVSEIMLQQTQVKTVIPFWERWMRELPTIEAVAKAPSAKIHKLWEGLGYYTRVRNLQKAAQQIVSQQRSSRRRGDESQTKIGNRQSAIGNQSETPHVVPYQFPDNFDEVLALPGIGRYTAGAICSIAFNQPTPILDGNVIRVLTRIFGIAENPKEKITNARLWHLAEELVTQAAHLNSGRSSQREAAPTAKSESGKRKADTSQSLLTSAATMTGNCSALNQSLMELGALICTPRSPHCLTCPVRKLCVAFKEGRIEELPNLGKRDAATARHFIAFAIEQAGKLLVRQRPDGEVNAHLWEFPNQESPEAEPDVQVMFRNIFGFDAGEIHPLCTVKHSITRYRITLEAFRVQLGGTSSTSPHSPNTKSKTRLFETGMWKTPAQMRRLAFTSAHRKVLRTLTKDLKA